MLSWHLYLLKLIRPVKNCLHTFLLSGRVRGFSGVDSPLAGVAATADGEDLSRVPAGIFTQPGHNKQLQNHDKSKARPAVTVIIIMMMVMIIIIIPVR